MNYLSKICNDEGSSLQGLHYEGGPEHDCTGKKSTVPYVAFPEEAKCLPWKCEDCLELCDDINVLLEMNKTIEGIIKL